MHLRSLLLIALAACATTAAPNSDETTPPSSDRAETRSVTMPSGQTPSADPAPRALGAASPEDLRWADSVLATLSLRQKAAQLVWATVLGDFVSTGSPQWARVRQWIERDQVGGFIISVGSPTEIAAKLNAMQGLSALPLLVGADVEFGAGYRARGGWFLPNGIDLGGAIVFPPEMALGAARDSTLAYEQGRVTAREGRAMGIHIAFTPILDVNNNPANPVINTRSFGEDPRLAAQLGVAMVRGLQDHGMLATGKHFPGHGDTGVNSHLALPVVAASRARLDTVELVPFQAAIDAGLGAMMTFHGAMPALDSTGLPGTLSRRVLTDLLRREMGFEGIIFSDAMDMRGVLQQFGPAEAAKRAVAAGADILIQPLDVAQTVDAVVTGLAEGRYPVSRIDEAARRSLALKHQLGLSRDRTVDVAALRRVVGDTAHAAAARRAAERSITLVRDSAGQVPLRGHGRNARVLSITLARRTDLAAGSAFDATLRRGFPRLRSEWVNADDPALAEVLARLLSASEAAEVTIVSSYVSHAWNATSAAAPEAFTNFLEALAARGKPIVVAMGNPYLLSQVPSVPAYLIAWGGHPVSQEAAARALLGEIPIQGKLPITIPPVATFGAGLVRGAR